jgi:hypothetical protein
MDRADGGHPASGRGAEIQLQVLNLAAAASATAIWKRALQEYQQPALDPGVLEEMDAYVARRRTEIGAGDP